MLEIVDRRTGGVISGTTQVKIAGNKILLQVRAQPAEALSNIQWTIDGTAPGTPNFTALKGYTMALAATTKTELSTGDLQGTTVDFHWVEGPSRAVTVTAGARHCSLSASVTYTVRRPTLDEFFSRTGPIGIGRSWGHLEMSCGTQTVPGINYSATVTPSSGGDGDIKFTQIMQALVEQDIPDGSGRAVTQTWSIPNWWLDLNDPYGNHAATAAASGTPTTIIGNDSPGLPLGPGAVRAEVRYMRFRLFVMYRSNEADSIWVPIGKLTWGWSGKSTSTDNGRTWRLMSGAYDPVDPTGALTWEFVEWVDRKTDSPPHPAFV